MKPRTMKNKLKAFATSVGEILSVVLILTVIPLALMALA